MSAAALEEVIAREPGFPEVRAVLREAGTGVRQSRHVKGGILAPAVKRVLSREVDAATAAAFLTAYTIFEPNEEEKGILAPLLSAGLAARDVRGVLVRLGYSVAPHLLWGVLTRLLSGGGRLSGAEVDQLVDGWLDGILEDPLVLSLLLAIRMTGESTEENRAFLASLRRRARITNLALPILVDLADPTDGFDRVLVPTPLVAAVLAQLGIPVVVHGLPGAPSKWGITHADLLGRLGYRFPRTLEEGLERLEKSGWVYLDQRLFIPALAAKIPARARMVKRSVINTVEKLILPVRAASGDTRILTGFVHKGYDGKILMIERESARCAVIAGAEGTIAPRVGRTSGKVRIGEAAPIPFTFISDPGIDVPEVESPKAAADYLARALADQKGIEGRFVADAAALVLLSLGLSDDAESARREASRALAGVRIS